MQKILFTIITVLLLTSCSKSAKRTLGLTENIPDEFQVTKAKPLEVPPHFNLSKTDHKIETKKKVKTKLSASEEAIMQETDEDKN